MENRMTAVVNAVNDYVQNGTFSIPVEFGIDLFAANYVPYSQLEYDRVRRVNSNKVVIYRGLRFDENDIQTNVNLDVDITPTKAQGGSDVISLDKTLTLAKLMYHKELADGGSEQLWSSFFLRDIKRQLDTLTEKYAIEKIRDVSTANFGEDIVADQDNKIDAFKTLLNITKKLALKGVYVNAITCYISPAFYIDLMTNGVIIANGQSEIQSRDVREGLGGFFRILGIYCKQDSIVPKVSGKNSESQATATPALIVITAYDNLWMFYNEWAPLAFVPVPASQRFNAIQLQYFVYVGFYIKDPSVSGVIFELPQA